MSDKNTYCGYAAIVGRPNVGKSTLLNDLMGFKLSITSSKPQTTRHRLLGVDTEHNYQTLYVDTPGLHQAAKNALNRLLNKAALRSLREIDVVLFVVECGRWQADDEWVLSHLKEIKKSVPVIAVVNKIDKFPEREAILPFLQELSEKFAFTQIVPISALKGEQIPALKKLVRDYLPECPFLFPEDMVSDRSERFIVAEMVREKLMRTLEQELPYGLTVTIEALAKEDDLVRISAIIWIEKEGHKKIVIGKGGDQLKKIGKLARRDLERYFGQQVYLQLWVKVKSGWSDDDRLLKQFGYDE
jgi:GTP-binding protein Era